MGYFYALAAIVEETIAKTVDKLNYRRNNIKSRQLMLLVFLGMAVSILLFIIVARKPFPTLTAASIGLVLLISLVSFFENALDYLSLKANDLSLREPMINFKPILGGLFGYVLFPAERKFSFLLAFISGTFIV